MMPKPKGRGRARGRPKESQTRLEEELKEPGSVKRELNVATKKPSRQNEVRTEQFQDVDYEYQQLTGKNDVQKHCPTTSKDHVGAENTPDDFGDLKGHSNGITGLQAETPHVDLSRKESMETEMYSFAFHQTLRSSPDINVPYISSSTARITLRPRTNIIKRPNFGALGRQIGVVSNYFLLKGDGNDIYHYDVEITDKSASIKTKVKTIKEEKASGTTQLEIQQKRNLSKQKCQDVINQLISDKSLEEFLPFYDGQRNLCTFRPLPMVEKMSIQVCMSDDKTNKIYSVTIQPANRSGGGNIINLKSLNEVCAGSSDEIPLEAVSVFDRILCRRDLPVCQISVGRSFFFFSEMRKHPVDGEVEFWTGYNQTLHLTQKGPAVVINVTSKAFRCGGFLIEHACDILDFDITEKNLKPEDIQKLKKSLRGLKVEVTHLPYPRRYTVESVTEMTANYLTVDIEGKRMSVSQFFGQKYRRLNFPDLPCLSMKTGRPTYIPMEFCVIPPGQPKLGKLNPKQTSLMINMTATSPYERFGGIVNNAKVISQISGTYMAQAGYNMQLTPLHLTARVISPPALVYSNGPSVQPDPRGVWRIDGNSFSESSSNAQWVLISFSEMCPQGMLQGLSSALVKASNNVGLHLRDPVSITSLDRRTSTFEALCDAKNRKIEFVLVILSRRDKHHSYEELKFIADVKLGLITQCMEDTVVPKCCGGQGADQILNNLLSKLNTKLGGINHTFSQQTAIFMKRTIVMGVDAAHSPRGSKCPSIAAVVGSIDDVPFQYAVSCKIQKNPHQSKMSQEIISDVKEMTRHILNSYKDRNGYFPEKIILFRDGVSQGQFETVLEKELTLIQRACEELFKRILPITFIVVQKSHQTRFMPKNPNDGIGRFGNIPPGTTVDTDVTHPVYFDYFLCSHEGIRGTSKPAHYVVLHDDNKFPADDLQKFCYDLCHVYARCNRSISIPAPAMNAHLAAARAKKYVDLYLSGDVSSSSGYSSDDPSLPQEIIDFVNNISQIKTPMFFV